MRASVLAAVLLLAFQGQPPVADREADELAQLDVLDVLPLNLSAELPVGAPDTTTWAGLHNRFTSRVKGVARGRASHIGFPQALVRYGLCPDTNDSACLLSLRYEMLYRVRTAPPREEVVLRVVIRNSAGKVAEWYAVSREPDSSQRYWVREAGSPWREAAGDGGEFGELHGFFADIVQLIIRHPVRKPKPKHGPVGDSLIKG